MLAYESIGGLFTYSHYTPLVRWVAMPRSLQPETYTTQQMDSKLVFLRLVLVGYSFGKIQIRHSKSAQLDKMVETVTHVRMFPVAGVALDFPLHRHTFPGSAPTFPSFRSYTCFRPGPPWLSSAPCSTFFQVSLFSHHTDLIFLLHLVLLPYACHSTCISQIVRTTCN